MKILAIDPRKYRKCFCVIDTDTYKPLEFRKGKNEVLELGIYNQNAYKIDKLVIEMIASYGMPVGKEVFETCVWIGRFVELAKIQNIDVEYIYRKDKKIENMSQEF